MKANNYPDWKPTIPNTGSASRDSEDSNNNNNNNNNNNDDDDDDNDNDNEMIIVIIMIITLLRSQVYYPSTDTLLIREVGFWGEGTTGVPEEKPLGAEIQPTYTPFHKWLPI